MSTVLIDPAFVCLQAEQIYRGDRVQFNIINGTFFFLRKNPEDDSTWIQLTFLNLNNDYRYEGSVRSFVGKLSQHFGYNHKKIEDTKYERHAPVFEFI